MPLTMSAIEVKSLAKPYGRHSFGQGLSLGVTSS
jgi:hypothetical protein